MEEAVMYGVAVALLMLGVPLWHSMGECRKGRLVRVHLYRWWLLCGLMVMLSLMIAVVCGVAGFVLENAAHPKAPRFSADCRILTKSVDIRSAKVCDEGHMAHLQKIRPNSNAPSKFRCSLDYYWSSLFQVEYIPRASKSAIVANAEVPSGDLSVNCRPSFATAWRTKETFQKTILVIGGLVPFSQFLVPFTFIGRVNGTYPCTYSSTNLRMVNIIVEKAGNCSTEEPSSSDLIKQFWYLLIYSENSIISPSGKAGELMSKAAAAVGVGIVYSMIVTGFTRTICQVHFHFELSDSYTDLDVVYFEARIQLAILFTASLFGIIWLSNHFFGNDVDLEFFNRARYQNTGATE